MADISTNLLPERARLESGDSFLVDAAAGTGRLTIGAAQNQLTRNRNLLHNWYFADPIDQRHGYFVNSGVTYYSDEGLATSAGTTSAAMTAKYVNATYGTVTIDGTTYYVAAADVVRGYGKVWSYSIDGWILSSAGSTLTVCNGYISLVGCIDQKFEHLPKGTYTASVMLRDGTLRYGTAVIQELNDENSSVAINNIGCFLWYDGHPAIRLEISPYIDLFAAKLELGEHQTLAHQDADGNWVLNDPPPNKALELLKCQRYYLESSHILISNDLKQSGHIAISYQYPIKMRAKPTITVISADPSRQVGKINDFGRGGIYAEATVSVGIYDNTGVASVKVNGLPDGELGGIHIIADANL